MPEFGEYLHLFAEGQNKIVRSIIDFFWGKVVEWVINSKTFY